MTDQTLKDNTFSLRSPSSAAGFGILISQRFFVSLGPRLKMLTRSIDDDWSFRAWLRTTLQFC